MMLRTSRLLLRELVAEDAAALHEIERDERVTRYMNFDRRSLEEAQAYIADSILGRSKDPRAAYDLAVVPHSATALIGRCGMGIRRPEHREAIIWYELHPEQWGRGYAIEAATALLDFAFDTLGLHRVWADCDPRNAASCRVAERLGMMREGVVRENYWLKGEWCSTVIYGLLEGEWRGRVGRLNREGAK